MVAWRALRGLRIFPFLSCHGQDQPCTSGGIQVVIDSGHRGSILRCVFLPPALTHPLPFSPPDISCSHAPKRFVCVLARQARKPLFLLRSRYCVSRTPLISDDRTDGAAFAGHAAASMSSSCRTLRAGRARLLWLSGRYFTAKRLPCHHRLPYAFGWQPRCRQPSVQTRLDLTAAKLQCVPMQRWPFRCWHVLTSA